MKPSNQDCPHCGGGPTANHDCVKCDGGPACASPGTTGCPPGILTWDEYRALQQTNRPKALNPLRLVWDLSWRIAIILFALAALVQWATPLFIHGGHSH